MDRRINSAIACTLLFFASAPLMNAAVQKDVEDDPDAHPPVTKSDLQIVQTARKILKDESSWNRSDTRHCPDDTKTFSLYCALEKATKEVMGSFQHRGAAMQEARFVIDEIAPNRSKYHHRLMDYNNDPSTTFHDIENVFHLMEDHIKKRLKQEASRSQQ